MKFLFLPLVFLVSVFFVGPDDHQPASNSNTSTSPCTRQCAVEGQELFDHLFIDEDKSYQEAHEAAIEYEGNCYNDCNGVSELDGSLKR